jgi:hypothetical protein
MAVLNRSQYQRLPARRATRPPLRYYPLLHLSLSRVARRVKNLWYWERLGTVDSQVRPCFAYHRSTT